MWWIIVYGAGACLAVGILAWADATEADCIEDMADAAVTDALRWKRDHPVDPWQDVDVLAVIQRMRSHR